MKVPGGGACIADLAGLFMLSKLVDYFGVGKALNAAIVPQGERELVHDRGRLLVLVMLMLAMGGTALTDIEQLRTHKSVIRETGVGFHVLSFHAFDNTGNTEEYVALNRCRS